MRQQKVQAADTLAVNAFMTRVSFPQVRAEGREAGAWLLQHAGRLRGVLAHPGSHCPHPCPLRRRPRPPRRPRTTATTVGTMATATAVTTTATGTVGAIETTTETTTIETTMTATTTRTSAIEIERPTLRSARGV